MIIDARWAMIMGVIFLLVFSPFVSATWSCGGQTWLDCSGTYTKECCISSAGVTFPMCIGEAYSCTERCVVSGSGDSYDDFRVCREGYKANCNVRNDGSIYNMACCDATNYPVWNEGDQKCWKEGWECTGSYQGDCASNLPYCVDYKCKECLVNTDCPDDSFCDTDNTCKGVPCESDGNECTDDVVVNHVCKNVWKTGCCLSDTNCAADEKCDVANKLCVPVICYDGDGCTTDVAENHICKYPWIEGCCHSDANCRNDEFCNLDTCEVVTCDIDTTFCANEVQIGGYIIADHGCEETIISSCSETEYCVEGVCSEIPFPWTTVIIIAAGITALTAGAAYGLKRRGGKRK